MKNITIINHPVAQIALKNLRNREMSYDKFRFHSDAICRILVAEAVEEIDDEQDVVVISILRAGIAMLSSVIQILPLVKVGFVGLARNEDTALASEYYWKLPGITETTTILITDPMLATGGSVHHVLQKIKNLKNKEIRLVSVISAPEGIEKVHADFPEVKIFTGSVDEGLDSKKYIVPGLGDYGDRYFGTES